MRVETIDVSAAIKKAQVYLNGEKTHFYAIRIIYLVSYEIFTN